MRWSRFKGWTRWPALLIAVILAGTLAGSFTSQGRLVSGAGRHTFLRDGAFGAYSIPAEPPYAGATLEQMNQVIADLEKVVPVLFEKAWRPRWAFTSNAWGFVIPLWVPATAFGALAALCWWPSRFGPGRCPKCGYDRAGLSATACCPECGHAAGLQS